MRKPIILPIKEPWFSMIRKGEKLEEYRECKDYYLSRFANNAGIGAEALRGMLVDGVPGKIPEYDILFRNGYSNESPSFTAHVSLRYGTGKKKWGAKQNHKYIILHIMWVNKEEEPDPRVTAEEAAEAIQEMTKGGMSQQDIELSDLPFSDITAKDMAKLGESLSDGMIAGLTEPLEDSEEEKELRTAEDYSEAHNAKEWLDDFLTFPKINRNGDPDYSAMEKYDEYHFEKAKMYVQTLYDLAIGT